MRAEAQTYLLPSRGPLAWDEAFNSFSRAIENDAINGTAYLWRAENYAALGYFDLAVRDYQRSLEIDPAHEIARRHLAIAYDSVGRREDALRLLEVGLANGYFFPDVQLLPAVAARGDRLGTLSILAVAFSDDAEAIRPLFRALTDPTFNDSDRRQAVQLVKGTKNSAQAVPAALLILKAYDSIVLALADIDPPIWWARDDTVWLKSQGRKRTMLYWHLPEYWREHGFPPQCRPVGDADFECR